MKPLNYFFFYAYAGLALLAGCWGVFGRPEVDFRVLFHLSLRSLTPFSATNLAAQYRFLRAMEFGFGIYCFVFRREIFSDNRFNLLFLATMISGTAGRILSVCEEGIPSLPMCFFLVFELAGIAVISLYSRKIIYRQSPSHA